jgi:hypothetical protein
MSLVKVKIIYDYYDMKRVYNANFYDRRKFNEFILRWIQNTSHNRSSSLGEDAEVDLSSSYFNFQIKGLLEKEKNITINMEGDYRQY